MRTAEGPSPKSPLLERFPMLARLAPRRSRRRIPFVAQASQADCGAACLTMVLAFHGQRADLGKVSVEVGIGRSGARADAIVEAARRLGLMARGVKVPEIEGLRQLEPGAILHWRFSHFVVLERMSRKGAWILDPASGRRLVPHQLLAEAFTGVALTFRATTVFASSRPGAKGLSRLVALLKSEQKLLVQLGLIAVVVQGLALALPLLMSVLVDSVIPRNDRELLVVLAWGLAAILIFNFAVSWTRSILNLQLRTRLDSKVTLDFLDHMVDLPYRFFQQRSAGDLIMRLNSNSIAREILTSSALSAVLDGSLVLAYLALMFTFHTGMALLALTLGILRSLVFVATRSRQHALATESLEAQAISRGYQVEMLAGIETLKATGTEKVAVERWADLFVDELNVDIARGRLSAITDSLLGALGMASPFALLIFGSRYVLDGEMSLGTMLAMNALALGFLNPLSALVGTGFRLQLLRSYLDRIRDVVDTAKEQDGSRRHAGVLHGRIALNGVNYRYSPREKRVVRDVSLMIEPGSFVALVGPSGAGKSTLAKLLIGLCVPESGEVLYDGRNLAELDLRSVRRQLGVVTQTPHLFSGSIRENIRLGLPHLSLSAIRRAAEIAGIHEEIEAMPLGYDTLLSDRGSSLSGGQIQRITLARAIAREPKILLLDEATSNLDGLSENAIQAGLSEMSCTRLVIAHRLSTVHQADVILVMDGGRIVEAGTHLQLSDLGGTYAQLLSPQSQFSSDNKLPADSVGRQLAP